MDTLSIPNSPIFNNKIVKVISVVTACLVFLLALGSFALSYNALQDMAIRNGITGRLSYIWPLLIDASLIVFSLAVVNAHLQSESTFKQWCLVGVYTIGTVTFNVLHAPANLQSQVVAAIAPISLFFSFELLMSQLKNSVQKYGLTLNVNQLTELLNTRQSEVDKKQVEVDKLVDKIEQLKVDIDQLKSDKKVFSSAEFDTFLKAQEARQAQVEQDRQARLDTLVDTLKNKPDVKVSTLADDLQVSRTTIYNDLSTLEEKGVVSKNGNGYKVTQ